MSSPLTSPLSHREILLELAGVFLKLGASSFGGPAAHIALIEQEIVARRHWIDRQEFLDLVGAMNLIPGPNSTELVIHIGQKRAGIPGLIVAGISFILPATLMVLLLAVFYVRTNSLPEMRWILTGVQPVVIAIIAHALSKLARTAIKNRFTFFVAVTAILLVACGINEVAVIFLSALAGLIAGAKIPPATPDKLTRSTPVKPQQQSAPLFFLMASIPAAMPTLGNLFFIFLKIGSIIYGSGYVLLAFLRDDFVTKTGWISDRQLLDAISIGQLTPGPLFTSATFIGYLIAQVPGALIATVGIFLPSFFFVAALSRRLEKLRASPRARPFLDAVNAASLALMAVVTWELARASIADSGLGFTSVLGICALLVLTLTKTNSLWLMIAGALIGFLWHR